ncbi:MAG: hypothetical protein HC814_06585, partial [Rhodobacteraceae bacterium]|nr:hypothetical protein [Paracoccaceae bacterium]
SRHREEIILTDEDIAKFERERASKVDPPVASTTAVPVVQQSLPAAVPKEVKFSDIKVEERRS